MKYYLIILWNLIIILFIGCEKSQENNENNYISINKIEQNITNKKTDFGCKNIDNPNVEECTEGNIDSKEFILNTLKRDLKNHKKSNIDSIKETLNVSLKEIEKENKKKSKLKDNLEVLVNEINENNSDTTSHKKISTIKDELKAFITLEDREIKPKVIKQRLGVFLENVINSKKDLEQTKKSLKNLVNEVEKKNSTSIKKFATAIIDDISNKKINIIDENKQYIIIKVKEGENLSLLAKRYYNDINKYKLIYEANKDKINSKYEIYPDSKLLIPKI